MSKTLIVWRSEDAQIEAKTNYRRPRNLLESFIRKFEGYKVRINLTDGLTIDAILCNGHAKGLTVVRWGNPPTIILIRTSAIQTMGEIKCRTKNS